MFQNEVLPAKDNQPGRGYSYIMYVTTGLRPNAGTRSRVYYNLLGFDEHSGTRRLLDVQDRVK